jgi:hypothetical protein
MMLCERDRIHHPANCQIGTVPSKGFERFKSLQPFAKTCIRDRQGAVGPQGTRLFKQRLPHPSRRFTVSTGAEVGAADADKVVCV